MHDFASGVIVSLVLGPFFATQGDEERLSQEVVGGHVHSLMVAHLADVASTDQHTINLFVWPSGDNSTRAVKFLSRQGFNITEWSNSRMQFWAVSDLSSTEL